jgi:hypothetical protein
MHCASHLGTLVEPHEGHDIGAKPEDGVWWTYPEDERTKQVLGPEMSPRRCKLTKLTLCQNPRQAPEHSKSPTLSFYKCTYV